MARLVFLLLLALWAVDAATPRDTARSRSGSGQAVGQAAAEPGFLGGAAWAEGDSRLGRTLKGSASYTLKRINTPAIGAGATSVGNYDPKNPAQWWVVDVSFQISAPAGTTCQTFESSGAAAIAIADAAAQSNVPVSQVTIGSCSSSGGRRRLQQAGGVTLNLTFQIRKQGTSDQVRKAADRVVDSINNGDLEKQFAAKGIDMQPKDAESNTKDPIKPVQRYSVLVSISSKGPSCQAFGGSKAARQYVLAAASLTGQPSPYISVGCADAGPAGRKKRHLILTLSINKAGTNDEALTLMNGLVADVEGGALASRLLAAGVTRFRPRGVISSSANIIKPKPAN